MKKAITMFIILALLLPSLSIFAQEKQEEGKEDNVEVVKIIEPLKAAALSSLVLPGLGELC